MIKAYYIYSGIFPFIFLLTYYYLFHEPIYLTLSKIVRKEYYFLRTGKLFGKITSAHSNVDYLITLWGLLLDYMIDAMTVSFRADIQTRF